MYVDYGAQVLLMGDLQTYAESLPLRTGLHHVNGWEPDMHDRLQRMQPQCTALYLAAAAFDQFVTEIIERQQARH